MFYPKYPNKYPKYTRRRLVQFALGFVLFGSMATSCSQQDSEPTASPIGEAGFKVALVVPRSREEDTWSQSGYQGLTLIEKELGVQVAYTEEADKLSPEQLERVFRQYANEDFNFIVAQGGQFQEPLEKVAAEFPRAQFALIGGHPGNQKNLGALGFRMTDVGYLFGAIAGLKTKTNKVAMLGGLPLPDYVDMSESFERGAKAVNREVRVAIEWVNSFEDRDKAKQVAQKTIATGADVILIYCGQANPAAIEIAAAKGVYILPIDEVERTKMPPETVLTTGLLKIPILLLEGTRLAQKGQWEGKQYRFGFENGAIELAPFRESLTSEQKAKIEALKEEIISGKVDVAP